MCLAPCMPPTNQQIKELVKTCGIQGARHILLTHSSMLNKQPKSPSFSPHILYDSTQQEKRVTLEMRINRGQDHELLLFITMYITMCHYSTLIFLQDIKVQSF